MAAKPGLLARGSPRPRPLPRRPPAPASCPACSRPLPPPPPLPPPRRRWQSGFAPRGPRADLERALAELQARHPGLVGAPRLRLALQGLRRALGREPVRVAVVGLGRRAPAAAVLRALLADPLGDEQPWERELGRADADADAAEPLIVRVAPAGTLPGRLRLPADAAVRELHVSSPPWDTLSLEFLLTHVAAPPPAAAGSLRALEEAVLAPSVGPSPVPAPVHQALLVADGLPGAVHVSALPVADSADSVRAAVQLRGVAAEQLRAPFHVIDGSLADRAIRLFRQGPHNAMEYQRLWSASNLPSLVAWLKDSAATTGQETKPAVKRLVASLLRNALASIEEQRSPRLSGPSVAGPGSSALGDLNQRLAQWAQRAHAELQGELDLAFTGRRWRKLGWWKLFWRVDDVAMLTNEMLSQRFLPTAEQELVYLAGRIAQCRGHPQRYPQPASQRETEAIPSVDRLSTSSEHAHLPGDASAPAAPKWPGHITFTRRYLQDETVPALQSLAQRLVVQSLGTGGLATSLAALLYVSSWASSLYEASAVAALGLVYSLGRMQKKWETARGYWEGEVREEGRKAVRGAEASVATVLDASESTTRETKELDDARELIAKAEDALARMR